MAKENINDNEQKADESNKKEAGFSMKKLIIIAIPVFIIQVVVVYFLVAKLLVPMTAAQPVIIYESQTTQKKTEIEENNLYVIGDIIINPAGTNATRFLLTTIGMQVTTQEAYEEIERNELQVRDVLNTILSSKRLDELVNVNHRTALREEIISELNELLHTGNVKKVFFSKFIIQ